MADSILQVPYGTRDVLPGEAAARRQMEDRICGLFTLWGYDEVATPTFEYLDTFQAILCRITLFVARTKYLIPFVYLYPPPAFLFGF